MRITAVRPWIVAVEQLARPLVFVQVDTDEGVTDWGEITTYPGDFTNRLLAGAVRECAGLLIGEDPSRIEALWNKVFRQFTYVGSRGAVSAVVSGIDIAL